MKIAIEAQRLYRKDKHGMDFVILELIRELQKTDLTNDYFIYTAPGKDRCLTSSGNFTFIELKNSCYPVWEQLLLPLAIQKLKPDILHCTSNTAPVYCSVPLIITVHDVIYLEKRNGKYKSFYQSMGRIYRKLIVPFVIKKSKRIITVSNYEAERISKETGLADERISVIYNGVGKNFKPMEKSRKTNPYIPRESFLFFLGNTDPKKNTSNTLKAYSIYREQSMHPLPLLIADLEEKMIDDYLTPTESAIIKPHLYLPGYIPNVYLPEIYNRAFVFLYPSLRESFGIPILEAMACGTPVITSATSAIPEIAGNQAILINPEEPQKIAEKLLELENNSHFYQQQVCYGLKRARGFSWSIAAGQLLTIYRSVNEQ